MSETVLPPLSSDKQPAEVFNDPSALLERPPRILESLPLAAYACDADGRICWFNRRAAVMWGRAPEIGDSTELFCGSYRLYDLEGAPIRREETPMAAVLRSGEPIHGREAMVERPDGTRVVAMVHVDPILDETGRVIGAINCFHDTSELHQANQALRHKERELAETERRFRDLLEALPAAVYTTDAAGRITFYNEAAVELSGRQPQLGSDQWCISWRLYHPDGRPMPHQDCPMAVTLRENRPVHGVELVIERPDGSRVPVLPYPMPLRDTEGALIGAVNMLVDISERRSAEANQKVLLDELNHRVKNNLQMLYSLLAAAKRETQSEEARSVLADVSRRVAAMAAAKRVLYGADGQDRFPAERFLKAVCANAQQAFKANVQILCAPVSGELSNDVAVPLALILNELLTNAAKHGPKGRDGVIVKVQLERTSEGYLLSVEDDGPGFAIEEVRKRSSGLGLVTGLAQQLGGSFEVERAQGARCKVRFQDRGAAEQR